MKLCHGLEVGVVEMLFGGRRLFLLNAPVIPVDFNQSNTGTMVWSKLNIDEAREIVKQAHELNRLISAIGHESTAKLLSELFGIEIPVNRVKVHMAPDDWAVVTALTIRLPEGKVLSEKEIRQLFDEGSIQFVLLRRIS